jgi:hypothetical protein
MHSSSGLRIRVQRRKLGDERVLIRSLTTLEIHELANDVISSTVMVLEANTMDT